MDQVMADLSPPILVAAVLAVLLAVAHSFLGERYIIARLLRRDDPEDSRRSVEARMRFLREFLEPGSTFVEFAPGDCRLAKLAFSTSVMLISQPTLPTRTPIIVFLDQSRISCATAP